MKKAAAILLAAFVGWSALQPCMDGRICTEPPDACKPTMAERPHACCSEGPLEKSQHHPHDQEEERHCTPFCSCHCCGASFVQHLPSAGTDMLPPLTQQQPVYLSSVGRDFPHLIWQPPPVMSFSIHC